MKTIELTNRRLNAEANSTFVLVSVCPVVSLPHQSVHCSTTNDGRISVEHCCFRYNWKRFFRQLWSRTSHQRHSGGSSGCKKIHDGGAIGHFSVQSAHGRFSKLWGHFLCLATQWPVSLHALGAHCPGHCRLVLPGRTEFPRCTGFFVLYGRVSHFLGRAGICYPVYRMERRLFPAWQYYAAFHPVVLSANGNRPSESWNGGLLFQPDRRGRANASKPHFPLETGKERASGVLLCCCYRTGYHQRRHYSVGTHYANRPTSRFSGTGFCFFLLHSPMQSAGSGSFRKVNEPFLWPGEKTSTAAVCRLRPVLCRFLFGHGPFPVAGCCFFQCNFCPAYGSQHSASHLHSSAIFGLWKSLWCGRYVQFLRLSGGRVLWCPFRMAGGHRRMEYNDSAMAGAVRRWSGGNMGWISQKNPCLRNIMETGIF